MASPPPRHLRQRLLRNVAATLAQRCTARIGGKIVGFSLGMPCALGSPQMHTTKAGPMHKRNAAAVLIVMSALLACKKPGSTTTTAAGETCEPEGSTTCQGLDTQLVCQGKVWRPYPCRGPNGCAKSEPAGASCDMSNNQAGDACSRASSDKRLCSGDKKSLLTCTNGLITTTRCQGPRGCSEQSGTAKCDESIAAVGSSCKEEGSAACSPDQKNYLLCKNGQRILEAPCRGQKGCFIDARRGDKVTCDASLGYAGDSCPVEQDGDFIGWACSINGGRLMTCNNGKFKYNYKFSCDGVCQVNYLEKGTNPFSISCG
jgi:hypothetical protein